MANDRVERQLDSLKALRGAGLTPESVAVLKKSLGDKVNLIVAKAAQLCGDMLASQLLPELRAAYERMFGEGKDPQCWAKNALAKTLKDLGVQESALFLRGLHHVQMEPVWGGSQDTAAVLRGSCALALVQCNDLPRDHIMRHLVDSLTDKEGTVRIDATRALEQMAGHDVVLLLRLKAKVGDLDPRVTGEVLEALLALEGKEAIPLVGAFLSSHDEEVADEAALALASSHLPEVFPLLQAAWQDRPSNTYLRAMSVSRLDEAVDFLLELVRAGRGRDAEEALHALELQKSSEELVKRVETAVAERAEPKLQALFQQRFLLA